MRVNSRSEPPFQHPGISSLREAKKCDIPAGAPTVPLLMGTKTLVCRSIGAVPSIHAKLKRHFCLDSPAISSIWANLIHSWRLAPWNILTISTTSARDMDRSASQSSDANTSIEDILVEELLKVLLPTPDNIPSPGQQFSTSAEENLSQALLSLSELQSIAN